MEAVQEEWIPDDNAEAMLKAVGYRFIVSESHWLRQLWDLLSAVLIIYSLILAPIDLAFRPYLRGSTTLFNIELFVDIFFLSDVLLNFFTTFIENGNEVPQLPSSLRHSRHSNMLRPVH